MDGTPTLKRPPASGMYIPMKPTVEHAPFVPVDIHTVEEAQHDLRPALSIADEPIPQVGALPVLPFAENQPHGLAGQRPIFDVDQLEIQIERQGLGPADNGYEYQEEPDLSFQ